MKKALFVPVLLACVALSAAVYAQDAENPKDPFERFNRSMHRLNTGLDNVFLKPLAKGYRYIMPDVAEKSVSNFFDNLTYPTVIVNQFLQGKFEEGAEDTGRFLLNSTFGVAGLFDIATEQGLPAHEEDFGQTLAVWGFEESPYVVLPLFGPSTVRDGFGRVGDWFTNPINYIDDDTARHITQGMYYIDMRGRYLEKEKILSGDKYVFLRDAYMQRREYLINDQQVDGDFDPFLDGSSAE